jgi:hypothetical protein
MLYILLILQTVLIVILLILFFYQRISFAKQKEQMLAGAAPKSKPTVRKKADFLGSNQRNDFRVPLHNKECTVEFLEFENQNLTMLKNKKFQAYLENISLKGAKLYSSYDLPVKQSILIESKFSLKEQEFCLKGEINRKEEYNQNNLVAYAIQFVNVSSEDQSRLSIVLNQILIEQRNK